MKTQPCEKSSLSIIDIISLQVREQDSAPENLEKLVPGLLSLKRVIEKVPGCEPAPPPTIDTGLITDFRSNIMEMMDRLTDQIRQTGNGEPPREVTHL
jgi:hypothetical protein